jgi:transcription initiation factor TFIID subunit 13
MDKITGHIWHIVYIYCYLQLYHSVDKCCPFSQVHKAQNVASKRGKLLTEDFLYLIRKVHCQIPHPTHTHLIPLLICSAAHTFVWCFKDLRKLHRATELLSMNEELKQARKAFDVDEETLATTNI